MFLAWRERKKREASEKDDNLLKEAREARAKGKAVTLSGRALFQFDPSLFGDEPNGGAGGGGGGGGEDAWLAAYKAKRQKDDGEDDDDEAEADYGRSGAHPLYDPAAQNEPADNDSDAGDDGADGHEAGGELEWFCDGCEGDILTDFRFDCPVCDDEFCYCEACEADPAKAHAHTLVRRARHLPHASSERGRGADGGADAQRARIDGGASGSGARADALNLNAVDESLFDDGDGDDDE